MRGASMSAAGDRTAAECMTFSTWCSWNHLRICRWHGQPGYEPLDTYCGLLYSSRSQTRSTVKDAVRWWESQSTRTPGPLPSARHFRPPWHLPAASRVPAEMDSWKNNGVRLGFAACLCPRFFIKSTAQNTTCPPLRDDGFSLCLPFFAVLQQRGIAADSPEFCCAVGHACCN